MPRRSEYVAVIKRYVQTRGEFRYGCVAQALAAALEALLADWMLIVTQACNRCFLAPPV